MRKTMIRTMAAASLLSAGLVGWSGCNTENPDGTPTNTGKTEKAIKDAGTKVKEEAGVLGKKVKEEAGVVRKELKREADAVGEGAKELGKDIKDKASEVGKEVKDEAKKLTTPEPAKP